MVNVLKSTSITHLVMCNSHAVVNVFLLTVVFKNTDLHLQLAIREQAKVCDELAHLRIPINAPRRLSP